MGVLSGLFSWIYPKIAVDIGSFRLRVASAWPVRLLEAPACNSVHNGVVVDQAEAVRLLRPLLSGAGGLGVVRPCVLTCAPTDVSSDERQRLIDTLRRAGAASVVVVPEPLAAAIGGGLDVSLPYAQLVIDIGEGVTDCAVIRSGALLESQAIRGGCGALRRMLAVRCGLSDQHADMLMRRIGTGSCNGFEDEAVVVPDGYYGVVGVFLDDLVVAVSRFIVSLPPHIGAEVIESGILLTGGGALLTGVSDYFAERIAIRTSCASAPLTAVIRGAQGILPVADELDAWSRCG